MEEAREGNVGQLSGDEASTIWMLLKRFKDSCGVSIACCSLAKLNYVEADYLCTSQERIESALKRIGLQLVRDTDNDQLMKLRRLDTCELITTTQLEVLKESILNHLATPSLFDYEPAIRALLRECIKRILEGCGYMKAHQEALRSIEPKKMEFSDEEFMVPYQIDFMGGAKNIMWPDANNFHERHIVYLTRPGARKSDRRLIPYDYRYESLYCPLHELMHCIQTELDQSDNSSWTAEHDASRLALVLLRPLSEVESLREYLPPGKMEEIVLFVHDQMSVNHPNFSEKQHAGYTAWRDSWGVNPPADLDAFSHAEAEAEFTDYLKYKVGFEAYIANKGQNWQAIMDTCFKDRTGNLAGKPVSIPSEASVPYEATFECVTQPIGISLTPALVKFYDSLPQTQ